MHFQHLSTLDVSNTALKPTQNCFIMKYRSYSGSKVFTPLSSPNSNCFTMDPLSQWVLLCHGEEIQLTHMTLGILKKNKIKITLFKKGRKLAHMGHHG